MEQGVTPIGLARYLPILGWLPGYPSTWLRGDLVAGLTSAAVVIPQSMAYAAIAGLPVEVGLYTALQALSQFEERLREQDVTLWLAGLNPEPLETIRRSPLGATLGNERMLFNVEQAVEAYQAMEKTFAHS